MIIQIFPAVGDRFDAESDAAFFCVGSRSVCCPAIRLFPTVLLTGDGGLARQFWQGTGLQFQLSPPKTLLARRPSCELFTCSECLLTGTVPFSHYRYHASRGLRIHYRQHPGTPHQITPEFAIGTGDGLLFQALCQRKSSRLRHINFVIAENYCRDMGRRHSNSFAATRRIPAEADVAEPPRGEAATRRLQPSFDSEACHSCLVAE